GKDSYGVLPFVEANWLYDSSTPEAKINGTRVKSDISKNQFEVKLGLNANFSKAVSGYAQFDGKFGSNSHSNVGAKVGLNYSF
ncbi:autotransporter outer membrane beta-barrel domain-containing protein, partial [Snodgrassella sp. B3882]|uniref:autotransporter outer membrane beta-barrel domain-containing protein n=1 Tax=Snodgrassella sp. B3882 TaxID=2818037 RepID=UPI00226ACD29